MTLYYFPIPGAPGELTRMVLTLGDFDWKVGAPKLHASSRRAQYIYISVTQRSLRVTGPVRLRHWGRGHAGMA